jgi:hypothetical protein
VVELVSQYDQYCKNYQSFLIRLGRHPHFSKLVELADFLMKTPEVRFFFLFSLPILTLLGIHRTEEGEA